MLGKEDACPRERFFAEARKRDDGDVDASPRSDDDAFGGHP